MADLRTAVVGAGNMGRHHVRLYQEMNGVELVAVVDPRPEADQLAALAGVPRFESTEAMLAFTDVDAVSVVVPTALHRAIAGACFEAGAHVLVEKPIAGSVEDARAMMEHAERTSRVLAVGHVERYNPVVRRLRELLRAGAIGTVSSVACRRLGGFPSIQPPTNVVIDLAIHDIDVVSFLTGESPQLLGAHGSRTFHPDQVDSAELLLRYGSASGLLQANWVTPVKVRTVCVTGSGGYVEANYVTQEIVHFAASVTPEEGQWPEFVSAFGNPRRVVHGGEAQEPLRLELEAFVSACRGEPAEIVEPQEAAEALEVALEAGRLIGQV